MNNDANYGRFHPDPNDETLGHYKTIITHCAICQNKLSDKDLIRMMIDFGGHELNLDEVLKEDLNLELLLYPLTYCGSNDICTNCLRSLEKHVERYKETLDKKHDQDFEWIRTLWVKNRFKNEIKILTKEEPNE